MHKAGVWIHFQRFPILLYCLIVLALVIKNLSDARNFFEVERIKFLSALHFSESFVESSHRRQIIAIHFVSVRVARIDLDSAPKFPLGGGELPVIGKFDHGQCAVCFGQTPIKLQRLLGRLSGFGIGFC